MATRRRFLVLDACVLIDLAYVDRDVLGNVCRSVGSIHVVRAVFDEVDDLDEAAAQDAGIRIVDPELDDLLTAAQVPRGALSFQDRLCLLVAQRRGWTCVSNDKPLRQECLARGVPVLWGLEMLALAASSVALTELEAAAWAIHGKNPRYVTKKLVTTFVAKLRKK
ncbi:MAG: hypothetical protein ACREJ3_07725 [Polyangiaceae bacterium]